jgi:transcriptional regulator with XRE-family HTH domain
VGYRGKIEERQRARELRALGWTYDDIASELGVSKSSVSLWARDVAFVVPPSPRRRGRQRAPSRLQVAKEEEIDRLRRDGRERVGQLSEREFLIAGIALYAGEGGKRDGKVTFANTDPRMIDFFCRWLRHFFVIDESRLRVALYLHEGLDLDAAIAFWSALTAIPPSQFTKPYRAVADSSIRGARHRFGCPAVRYSCSRTHRAVLGLIEALLTCEFSLPG